LFVTVLGTIVSGETTKEEVYQILEFRQDVTALQSNGPVEGSSFGEQNDLDWIFADDRSSGMIQSDTTGKYAELLSFWPQNLTLVALFEAYGQPDRFILWETESRTVIDAYLFLPSHLMFVQIGMPVKDRKVEFLPNTRIFRFYLATTKSYDRQFMNLGGEESSIEWHGYGEYELDTP
jgi:hypothetical protein